MTNVQSHESSPPRLSVNALVAATFATSANVAAYLLPDLELAQWENTIDEYLRGDMVPLADGRTVQGDWIPNFQAATVMRHLGGFILNRRQDSIGTQRLSEAGWSNPFAEHAVSLFDKYLPGSGGIENADTVTGIDYMDLLLKSALMTRAPEGTSAEIILKNGFAKQIRADRNSEDSATGIEVHAGEITGDAMASPEDVYRMKWMFDNSTTHFDVLMDDMERLLASMKRGSMFALSEASEL